MNIRTFRSRTALGLSALLLAGLLSGCSDSEVADVSLADPSDSAISCRQTGDITPAMIDAIDKSRDGEVIFTRSKSIFFKTMKIRRIYDPANQTLIYLSYSTKETSGSFKHSISTVPLWGSSAYQKPLPPAPGKEL